MTTDERFKEAPQLRDHEDRRIAAVTGNREAIHLAKEFLNMREARALRTWLSEIDFETPQGECRLERTTRELTPEAERRSSESPAPLSSNNEVALNQGPRRDDGVGSNPELRAQRRQDSLASAETLLREIRAWLQGKGQQFSCARGYGNSHDSDCEACLLLAAHKLLDSPVERPSSNERLDALESELANAGQIDQAVYVNQMRLAVDEIRRQNRDVERLRALIQRVLEWEPAFPVEASLLDDLAAAVKGLPVETEARQSGLRCPHCQEIVRRHCSHCGMDFQVPPLSAEKTSSDVYGYAVRLLNGWVNRFGRPSHFAPLPDLMGVLTQIDNVVAGLLASDRAATSPQAPIAKVIVPDGVSGGAPCQVELYAPGLPPGEHDLYCEPPALGGQKVPHPAFDPLRNFAEWVLGAHDCEGMVQHIIDNARDALEHAGFPQNGKGDV